MSDTLDGLRRQIDGAGDLESVVRSMKALAAASIGQYEKSVLALVDYARTVELGLMICLRNPPGVSEDAEPAPRRVKPAIVVVFGSDQGLVGQFNDVLADYVADHLNRLPGEKDVWAVGDRIHDRLSDAGLPPVGLLAVPTSVHSITPLVSQVLLQTEAADHHAEIGELYLFHNSPRAGSAYEPVHQQLLPLDAHWGLRLRHLPWPSARLPEVVGSPQATFQALIREYLFVSLFKACAESLASENASRLAAMQRAEKNIDGLLADLHQTYRRLRQSSIDEELFEVVSGYEALSQGNTR